MSGGSTGAATGATGANSVLDNGANIMNTIGAGVTLPSTSAAAAAQAAGGTNIPQWLKGLQAGQQLAQTGMQMGALANHPAASPMAPRPAGVGGAMPMQGLMNGVIPGSAGMAPTLPSTFPGANTGMQPSFGMQGGMNPQFMAMLQRARGM